MGRKMVRKYILTVSAYDAFIAWKKVSMHRRASSQRDFLHCDASYCISTTLLLARPMSKIHIFFVLTQILMLKVPLESVFNLL